MDENEEVKKVKDKNQTIKGKFQILKKNNKFFKFILNGKNMAILILSFLLFCALCAYTNPVDVTQYENKITELNAKLEYNEKQITNLQEANKLLQESNSKLEEEKSTLEGEKQTLENEKNELTTKVDELKNASSTSSTTTSSSSEIQKSSTSTASSSTSNSKSSSVTSTTSSTNNDQSYTVYITNTGSKYHSASCSYLRKSKIAITLNEAKSKGYTACSKCNP